MKRTELDKMYYEAIGKTSSYARTRDLYHSVDMYAQEDLSDADLAADIVAEMAETVGLAKAAFAATRKTRPEFSETIDKFETTVDMVSAALAREDLQTSLAELVAELF